MDGIELSLSARVVELIALTLLAERASGSGDVGREDSDRARAAYRALQKHLSGRAKEALQDLEQSPESEDNQADLRKQLLRSFGAEPSLAAEIAAIVPEQTRPRPGGVNIQQVGSALNKAAQIAGSFNKIRID